MFNSIQEAIDLANEEKKQDNDGGVPVFETKSVPILDRNKEAVDYEDQVWVKIFNKGDNKNVMVRPMREEDKKRWPKHWAAFCENREPDVEGIPLTDFPKITPAERDKCKMLHIRSVEELAQLPDNQLDKLGGRGRALQSAAKKYLEFYNADGYVAGLKQKIKDLEDEVTDLKFEIARLEEQHVADSISNNSKRSDGDKPAKAKRNNGGKSKSRRKGVSDSSDGLQEAGEEGLA